MDKIIAELLAGASALTEALTRSAEATNRNSDLLERVVAGQEAALAKLDGATAGGRGRAKKAAETAEAPSPAPTASAEKASEPTPEPVAAEASHVLLAEPNGETEQKANAKGVMEQTPTANFRAADFSTDQVKSEFIGWLGETTDANVRKERSEFVGAVAMHFGVSKPFAAEGGLTTDEQRKQTLFFMRRKRAGLQVDFKADYDFDADPLTQGAPAEEEDPLG